MPEMSGEIRASVEDLPDFESAAEDKLDGLHSPMKKVYSCDLCNIQVTSNNVLRRHKEGRKHLMRMERQGKTFICELCEITANSQSQLDAHLRSSKHKARLTKKENVHKLLSKGVWIMLIGVACIFINFLILFKMVL